MRILRKIQSAHEGYRDQWIGFMGLQHKSYQLKGKIDFASFMGRAVQAY